MKSLLITFLFSLSLTAGLLAQPLSIDSTFQPFFDIRSGMGTKTIHDIWEDPNTGELVLIGNFGFTSNGINHNCMTNINRDGSLNSTFKGSECGSMRHKIIPRENDTLLLSNGHYIHVLKNGEIVKKTWRTNYRKSVRCSAASEPYFFQDGSALMSNSLGNNTGYCNIVLPPDTFPHRYIVKIDPQGFWDSTFTPDANYDPKGFIPYDSNRIFVYGQPWAFTHYDGVRVNGLCRIYLDGTLDTTFKTPLLSDTFGVNIGSIFKITKISDDGSFFIVGTYYLEEFGTDIRFKVLKFHADGTIDSSFSTNQNIEHWGPNSAVNDIVSTPDGGYIVAGGFDNYHGYEKYNLVKLDSMGNVDPEYFTTKGPDSSVLFGSGIVGVGVIKSNFGGYYVYGNFLKWDGKPSQPIVRIKEFTTSLEEKNRKEPEIEVFPNPSQSIFNVQSTLHIKQLILFNLSGNQLNTINCISNCSINLSNYSSGVYLLRLILDNGAMHHRKLIKH